MLRLNPEPVRAFAKRRNQSLSKTAVDLGIEPRQIYRYFKGAVEPSPATRARICTHLGLPFEALFIEDGDAK